MGHMVTLINSSLYLMTFSKVYRFHSGLGIPSKRTDNVNEDAAYCLGICVVGLAETSQSSVGCLVHILTQAMLQNVKSRTQTKTRSAVPSQSDLTLQKQNILLAILAAWLQR
jgi:hypothetical protein